MTIPKRTLGIDGPKVGAIGYGAMVLEEIEAIAAPGSARGETLV